MDHTEKCESRTNGCARCRSEHCGFGAKKTSEERQAKGRKGPRLVLECRKQSKFREVLCSPAAGAQTPTCRATITPGRERAIGWICTGLGQTKKSRNSLDSPIGQPTTVLTILSINDAPADQPPTCNKIPCWSSPAPPVRPGSFDPPWRWANGQLRRERRRRRGHDDHAPTATASVREVRLWWE